MTELEYWQEIESLAMSIIEETRSDNPDMSEDNLLDAINERVHETIDGHHWIIYYSYNLDIIKHSNNEDYMSNEIGGLDETLNKSGFDGLCLEIAFWAMYADVQYKINDLMS